MTGLIDPTALILGDALRGLSQRETAIGTNIANVDTPGYQPVAVDFEGALQAQAAAAGLLTGEGDGTQPLRRTDPRQFTGTVLPSGGDILQTTAQAMRNDGNTVDVDAQMTELADTQIRYSGVSRMLAGSLAMLREAMTPGA